MDLADGTTWSFLARNNLDFVVRSAAFDVDFIVRDCGGNGSTVAAVARTLFRYFFLSVIGEILRIAGVREGCEHRQKERKRVGNVERFMTPESQSKD